MDDVFRFRDDLGPEKVLFIHDVSTNLRAIVVVDNTAAGPSIGGVRMAPDVGVDECFRLARAMTLKNAAAGLPHGGGKSVIYGNPHLPVEQKSVLLRSFAHAIRELTDYIPGPDMGTNEICMAWVRNEIGRAVGLPRELGGIPLDEIGATGRGLAAAVVAAESHVDLEISSSRVAIQGFGAVGKHAARFLAQRGARLVAASDSQGTLHDPAGLDVEALIQHKNAGRQVADYPDGQALPGDAIVEIDCDIWIPAARPDVVTGKNVGKLRTKLVAEGANIPLTMDAEEQLHSRGVLVLPDFIANAGGVICGSVEYHGGTETLAATTIEERITANVSAMLEIVSSDQVTPRVAAERLARKRVMTAMSWRQTH